MAFIALLKVLNMMVKVAKKARKAAIDAGRINRGGTRWARSSLGSLPFCSSQLTDRTFLVLRFQCLGLGG